jgi:hypothetical protein
MNKIKKLIITLSVFPLLSTPAYAQFDPQAAFDMLKLDLAVDYVGYRACEVSRKYPSTSLEEKQKIIMDTVIKDNMEELMVTYRESIDTKLRTRLFKDYIDANCGVDFIQSNWSE